ncbi:phage gp6-like head-tail connector protein [Bacillus lacus]|uniref:Phage gp6-like head-tail connector protein n=1 Tax=Metabacillus lacus TaxID=1983721 RepID=A0A7X2LVX5_9BACI|nr:phage gp6-like head-tail connector protein [Metabacillus lacus]MRX70850.1 phage gp6-like head-tail connector protein [Metabacillus lacus]
MDITPGILERFKGRMRITHSSEDETLIEMLQASYEDIQGKCGTFDITSNLRGRELVFERTRYVYNDALEYFNDNFLSQLNSFGFDNVLEEGDGYEG